jgi:flavodoxin
MAKVLIVHESKHGNTKLAAEAIGEGMQEAPGVETAVVGLKEAGLSPGF